MKFATAAVLVTSALGVSAHPSGHHAHQNAHRSLEARNEFVMYQKPPPPEPTTTSVAPPPAPTTSTTSQAPAPEPTETKPKPSASVSSASSDEEEEEEDDDSSEGTGLGVSSYTEFCGGKKRSIKRATLAEIAYKGNVGTADNYGCNYQLVKSNVAEKYKYLSTIKNIDSSEYECVAYNKIGPDGGINGFFDGNEALRFKIPGGGVQHLAADENTQGGVICYKGEIPLTDFGEFGSTWAEFDFGNESNGGWSGADASCLVPAALNMDIPGLELCGHDTCSTIFPGGEGENAFLAGMEALDGLGLNIPPGKVRLEIVYGFTG